MKLKKSHTTSVQRSVGHKFANAEIRGTVSETSIKVRRLEWAGNLERISYHRIAKKVYVCVGKPDGRRKKKQEDED